MTMLETERLLIRNFRGGDWEALHEIISQYKSSEFAAYDQQWPTSPEEIKRITEWFASGDSYLAVCLKATGRLIGFVALNQEQEADRTFNLGYIFHFDYHGQGYATEGCRAVLAHAFDGLQAHRVVTGTAAANRASCRLLERLGFKKTSENTASFRTTPDGKPIQFVGYTFELSRDEWNVAGKHGKTMTTHQSTRDIMPMLIQWAAARSPIRAVLLTSTRAIPDALIDALSDYDVILVVQDIHPFVADRTWLSDFGDVLVAYWDPIYPDPVFGIERCGNVTQYADGLKIDFNLWPVALFRQIVAAPRLPAELDAGYRVLLDKDGLTDTMRSPTFTAYVPAPPSLATYQTLINDFLSDAPYVAKCLWRDELLPAKWCLDYDMKHTYLRQLLEWRMEIDHGWSVPAGSLGKGLKKRLPPDIWAQVEQTYAGARLADNWDALAHTMALFRRVAVEVGQHLGYTYPDELHRRVGAYVEQIKRLERPVSLAKHNPQP